MEKTGKYKLTALAFALIAAVLLFMLMGDTNNDSPKEIKVVEVEKFDSLVDALTESRRKYQILIQRFDSSKAAYAAIKLDGGKYEEPPQVHYGADSNYQFILSEISGVKLE